MIDLTPIQNDPLLQTLVCQLRELIRDACGIRQAAVAAIGRVVDCGILAGIRRAEFAQYAGIFPSLPNLERSAYRIELEFLGLPDAGCVAPRSS